MRILFQPLWTILVLFDRKVYTQHARNMSLLFLPYDHNYERRSVSAGDYYIDGICRVSQRSALAPAFAPVSTPTPH
jgi:hypothetical protein